MFTTLFQFICVFPHTRITFDTTEDCYEWSRLITTSESSLKRLDDIFAFKYYDSLLDKDALQQYDDNKRTGMVVVNRGISALNCSSGSATATSSKKTISGTKLKSLYLYQNLFLICFSFPVYCGVAHYTTLITSHLLWF